MDYFDKIDAYFQGRMTSKEEKVFLEDVDSDKNLKKAFDNYLLTIETFHAMGELTLDGVKEIEKISQQNISLTSKAKSFFKKWWRLSILSIVILIGLFWVFNYFLESRSDNDELESLANEDPFIDHTVRADSSDPGLEIINVHPAPPDTILEIIDEDFPDDETKKSSPFNFKHILVPADRIFNEKDTLIDLGIWSTENLKIEPRSEYYEADYFKHENSEKFGFLYTYRGATRFACPSGWSIPTISEWKRLLNVYGGYVSNLGKINNSNFKKEENTYYNLRNDSIFVELGGIYEEKKLRDLNKIGFYWAEGSLNNGEGYAIQFISEDPDIVRAHITSKNKSSKLSCLCIKNKDDGYSGNKESGY